MNQNTSITGVILFPRTRMSLIAQNDQYKHNKSYNKRLTVTVRTGGDVNQMIS